VQLLPRNQVTNRAIPVDEDALADREKQAHGVEKLADIQAVTMPGERFVRLESEVQIAANREDVDRHSRVPLVNMTSLDDTVGHELIKPFLDTRLTVATGGVC